MDTPPKPNHLPEWASDELPLLTETIGEPAIPLLREPLLSEPVPDVPLLREPVPAELPLWEPPLFASAPPPAPAPAPAPPEPPAITSTRKEPLAQIERELHAAAQLIMQEVIDDYMLQIEAELHRRLEDHLAKILRAGRR